MKQHNIDLDTGTMTGLPKSARQTLDALDSSVLAGKALSAYLQQAQSAAKALATSLSKVRRVLAGFDQINRLGTAITAKTTSSAKKTTTKEQKEEEDILQTEQIQEEIVVLSRLQQVLQTVGNSLRALWETIMVPFGTWIQDVLCPAFSQWLTQAVEVGSQKVSAFIGTVVQLWQRLQELVSYISQGVLVALQKMWQGFTLLLTDIIQGGPRIRSCLEGLGQVFSGVWSNGVSFLDRLRQNWLQTMGNMGGAMAELSAKVNSALDGILVFLLGGFLPGWSEGFAGLKDPVKGMVNGIIGCLNKLLSALTSALNGVVTAANQLQFTLPGWIPGLGGKRFGLSLKTVTAPQIPYLAQGAVLPANRPFLAMVGDQRHGTNVEAPLTTIQQAVAAVMEDYTAGNMAGHEATVQMLRQILEAVLGIDIGDGVIAQAAHRHQLKTAVMRGGSF